MPHSKTMLPPIYVISLARAADRRANIVARLNAAGVDYELMNAVDGQTDLDPYRHRVVQNVHVRHHQKRMSDGAIGCVISHINLWSRVADEKIPVALILEDDADWDDDFFEIITRVISCDWQWDMVMLSHEGGSKRFDTLEHLSPKRKLVRRHRPGWGCAAYLVRLSGVEKLLPHCQKIYFGTDNFTREYWRGGLQTFDIIPNPAYPTGEESVRCAYETNLTRSLKRKRAMMRLYRKFRRKWYHFTNPPSKREGCV